MQWELKAWKKQGTLLMTTDCKASGWVPSSESVSEGPAVRVSVSLLPNLPHPRNLKQVKKAAKVL